MADIPEKKFILAQKRFWFAVLALVASIVLAAVNGARTAQEFAADDGVRGAVLSILTILGVGGAFLSSFNGSKPTALTPSSAKDTAPPAPPSTPETKP